MNLAMVITSRVTSNKHTAHPVKSDMFSCQRFNLQPTLLAGLLRSNLDHGYYPKYQKLQAGHELNLPQRFPTFRIDHHFANKENNT